MLTMEQVEQRKSVVSASEVPMLFGLGFGGQNASDLWARKTEKIVEDRTENKWMGAGNYFEVGVLDWGEEQLGQLLRQPSLGYYRDPEHYMGCTPDAMVVQGERIVQAKTSGLFGPLPEGWGDEGTDEVPDFVVVQVMAEMAVMQKDEENVVAFLGGKGFTRYVVPRDEELIKMIRDRVVTFWEKNVLKDVEPEDVPTIETLKRWRRKGKKVITYPKPELIKHWETCKAVLSSAKKDEEYAKRCVLDELGDAEVALYEDDGNQRELTFFEQSRGSYTVEPVTFRVARTRKFKPEKQEGKAGIKSAKV